MQDYLYANHSATKGYSHKNHCQSKNAILDIHIFLPICRLTMRKLNISKTWLWAVRWRCFLLFILFYYFVVKTQLWTLGSDVFVFYSFIQKWQTVGVYSVPWATLIWVIHLFNMLYILYIPLHVCRYEFVKDIQIFISVRMCT